VTILALPAAKKRLARHRLWHRHLVIWAPRMAFERHEKTFRVCFDTVLRRWSKTYNRWLYAPVGTVEEGTRYTPIPKEK
jgi:hypothetical protein